MSINQYERKNKEMPKTDSLKQNQNETERVFPCWTPDNYLVREENIMKMTGGLETPWMTKLSLLKVKQLAI